MSAVIEMSEQPRKTEEIDDARKELYKRREALSSLKKAIIKAKE